MTDQFELSNFENDKELLKDFFRHIISISVRYRQVSEQGTISEEIYFYNFTAFIIGHPDQWFLITAGHVLTNLREASESPRVQIIEQNLVDIYGSGTDKSFAIPFNCLENKPVYIHDNESHMDSAIVPLSSIYMAGLAKNGIVPLQIAWNLDDIQPGCEYAVLGFPEEKIRSAEIGGSRRHLVTGMWIPLEHLPRHPETNAVTRMVFRIIDPGDLIRLRGMSGGPILQFKRLDEKSFSYRAVAIQVEENVARKLAFGCPIVHFIRIIRARAEELNVEFTP